MRIEQDFDCTQRELVIDIARIIYAMHGCTLPRDKSYLWESEHPLEMGILNVSEQIFELFYGDSPDYSDEKEDDEDEP